MASLYASMILQLLSLMRFVSVRQRVCSLSMMMMEEERLASKL